MDNSNNYDNEVRHTQAMTQSVNRAEGVQSTWYSKCSVCNEYHDRREMVKFKEVEGAYYVCGFCADERQEEYSRKQGEQRRSDEN